MNTTQSSEIGEIAAAMVAVQSAIGPAIKGKKNPFFKSNYADLSEIWQACRDALQANGIAVIQGAQMIDGKTCMETKLIHTSGQWLSSLWEMMPAKNDPQAMGSAITYMRRYSLSAMVGILAEDDDGNAAARPPEKMEQDRQRADSRAADAVGGYMDKQAGPKPWGEKEWKQWFVGWRKMIDACTEAHQVQSYVASNERLKELKSVSPAMYEAAMDHALGREEILMTPTGPRDLGNILDAG